MRKHNLYYFIITTFVFFALVLTSEVKGQDSEFVQSKNEGWLVDMEKAYELSTSTDKPILANFTGSDWCGWCKKLRAEVFNTPEFLTWADKNVILLELDYPKRTQLPDAQKRQNYELQRAFQVNGFPTIWVFDLMKPEGGQKLEIHPYGKTGYVAGGQKVFIKDLNKMLLVKKQAN